MPMTTLESAVMVAMFALATILTRTAAFVAFPAGRKTPQYVLYLGRVLPFAITGMLIVYCLKDAVVFGYPYGLPELISIAVVAGVFLVFKNSLAAIAGGTVLYMVLVQLVFRS